MFVGVSVESVEGCLCFATQRTDSCAAFSGIVFSGGLACAVLFHSLSHAEAMADDDRFAEGGCFGQQVTAAGELFVCGKDKIALRYQGIEATFIGNLF